MRLTIAGLLCALALPATEIPKGSHALLRLVNSISTRTAREGDYVYMRTATPIVSGGAVVVPADSYVQGVVTRSVRSGRVKGNAELAIRIETLTLATGKVIQLNPTLASVDSEGTDQRVVGKENEVKQGPSKGTDAVRIATTSGTGAALGAIVDRGWRGAGIGAGAGAGAGVAWTLLTRGREVDLRQGSTIDVVFDRAVPVE
jgi:type IV secretion system protein VirB10